MSDDEEPRSKRVLDELRRKSREAALRNPVCRLPGRIAPHSRLLELLPSLRESVASPINMLPDAILDAGEKDAVIAERCIMFNPWRGDPTGWGDKAWDDYEPLELFDVVFSVRPPSPGRLWIVTDDCFGDREPFETGGSRLRDFVEEHAIDLCMDVLFIWADEPRVSLTHHEGAYFHILCDARR